MNKVNIFRLQDNIILNKLDVDNDYFYCNDTTVVISIFNLLAILKFMLFRGLISKKVLEGLLSEYSDYVEQN